MLHIVWIESLCGMEEICLHCFGLQQQQQTRIWQYFNYFICRDFLIGFQRTTQNNFKRKQIYGSQFMKQNCQLLLLSRHSSVFVCIWGRRVMQCFFAICVCFCHLCRSVYSVRFHFCCYHYYSIVKIMSWKSFFKFFNTSQNGHTKLFSPTNLATEEHIIHFNCEIARL